LSQVSLHIDLSDHQLDSMDSYADVAICDQEENARRLAQLLALA
jgi:hypothetical protein